MARSTDLTTAILRQIRDEIVATRTELSTQIADTRIGLTAAIAETRAELCGRIDETNSRLGVVETTVLELAQQQRFVVRHLQTLTARDRKIEDDVTDLRTRVTAIERRLPGPRRRS